MILLRGIRLAEGEALSVLRQRAAKKLRVPESDILELRLVKRSLDARKKNDIHYTCAAALRLRDGAARALKRGAEPWAEPVYEIPKLDTDERPVVVGFGPAGMFAALVLARAGCRPIVLERGRDAGTRARDVEAFRKGGPLDPESNVQFGEGGAGTYSDGKLNTGTSPACCGIRRPRRARERHLGRQAPHRHRYPDPCGAEHPPGDPLPRRRSALRRKARRPSQRGKS